MIPALLLVALLGACDKGSVNSPDAISPPGPPVAKASPKPPGLVKNQPPVAIFYAMDPVEGKAPLSIRFDMCGTKDPDGDTLRYIYDFGEGDVSANLSSCWGLHAYGRPGAFVAHVCVTDGQDLAGHEVCHDFRVTVLGAPPARTTTYSHAIGFFACPTKATTFTDTRPIVGTNAAQARLACDACMGAGVCTSEKTGDNGLAYGDLGLKFAEDGGPVVAQAKAQPRWGYTDGCSDVAGGVFQRGLCSKPFGRWAN